MQVDTWTIYAGFDSLRGVWFLSDSDGFVVTSQATRTMGMVRDRVPDPSRELDVSRNPAGLLAAPLKSGCNARGSIRFVNDQSSFRAGWIQLQSWNRSAKFPIGERISETRSIQILGLRELGSRHYFAKRCPVIMPDGVEKD